MKLKASEITNIRPARTTGIQTLSHLGQYIRQQRKAKNLTLDQLAEQTGISKPYLSNIENARLIGPPSEDILARIEKILAINTGELSDCADWLRTPKTIRQLISNSGITALPRLNGGAVDLDRLLCSKENHSAIDSATESENKQMGHTEKLSPKLINVPLINRVAAGSPAEFTDLDYPTGIADAYIPAPQPASTSDQARPEGVVESGMFALRVQGDSMSPQYLPGDIIVFSTLETPSDGDDCLIRLDEQGNFATTFKRTYFVDALGHPTPASSHVQLCPLNPRHSQRLVAREQITSLYPAVWKITPTPRRSPAEHPVLATHGTGESPSSHLRKISRRRQDTPGVNGGTPAMEPDATAEPDETSLNRQYQSATQRFEIETD